jgi:hypothetical protein
MEWIEITEDNRYDLKVGELIKYHNGQEWVEMQLSDFEIDYGYIPTNLPSKRISLVHSRLSEIVYVWR